MFPARQPAQAAHVAPQAARHRDDASPRAPRDGPRVAQGTAQGDPMHRHLMNRSILLASLGLALAGCASEELTPETDTEAVDSVAEEIDIAIRPGFPPIPDLL